ncbi:hypothetical protein HKX48_008995 [Thoreauomyces humboldtii]|nr:hypothetical protein HKX48_008995 [Thoreauomyces humboldtii]
MSDVRSLLKKARAARAPSGVQKKSQPAASAVRSSAPNASAPRKQQVVAGAKPSPPASAQTTRKREPEKATELPSKRLKTATRDHVDAELGAEERTVSTGDVQVTAPSSPVVDDSVPETEGAPAAPVLPAGFFDTPTPAAQQAADQALEAEYARFVAELEQDATLAPEAQDEEDEDAEGERLDRERDLREEQGALARRLESLRKKRAALTVGNDGNRLVSTSRKTAEAPVAGVQARSKLLAFGDEENDFDYDEEEEDEES